MTTANSNLQEFENLVSQLLDDSISKDDHVRLEFILRTDHEARKRYKELLSLESMLHWEFGDAVVEAPAAKVSPVIDFTLWLRPAMALAACFIAAFAGWWIVNDEAPVIEGHDVANTSPEKPNDLGEQVVFSEKSKLMAQAVKPVVPAPKHKPVFDNSPKTGFASNLVSVPGVNLAHREREALVDAVRGVEILQSGRGFGEGGYVEVTEKVTAWRADDEMKVGAEFGVQPFEGMDMLRLSSMEVDVFKQKAEVSELVRVLDVRSLGEQISDNKAVVKSAVRFNQGVGIADAGTAFAISLHAIDREGQTNIAVGREESRVMSDGNPATWERVESEIKLPEGTDFVVVALSAHKEGPQALLPDLSGHYADGLEIAMAVEGRPVYGRL